MSFWQFERPVSPSSEIAPPKPPRPAPQAHQPPELPQKGSRKETTDVNQRSSTESSGSDGTEAVDQVIICSCQSITATNQGRCFCALINNLPIFSGAFVVGGSREATWGASPSFFLLKKLGTSSNHNGNSNNNATKQ